jgi:hypothetical protein
VRLDPGKNRRLYLKNKGKKKSGGIAQVVELLPSKSKVYYLLSLSTAPTPSPPQKKENWKYLLIVTGSHFFKNIDLYTKPNFS